MPIVDMHWQECAALADYITQLDDPLTTIVKTTPTPIQCHIIKHLNHHLRAAPELTDAIHLHKLKRCHFMDNSLSSRPKYHKWMWTSQLVD
eukprot:10678904-Ditylum_brightwellii.AAC.1